PARARSCCPARLHRSGLTSDTGSRTARGAWSDTDQPGRGPLSALRRIRVGPLGSPGSPSVLSSLLALVLCPPQRDPCRGGTDAGWSVDGEAGQGRSDPREHIALVFPAGIPRLRGSSRRGGVLARDAVGLVRAGRPATGIETARGAICAGV